MAAGAVTFRTVEESFLVLFFKKEPLAQSTRMRLLKLRKKALLFEKRSKNFLSDDHG
jgi:hypothetical protein